MGIAKCLEAMVCCINELKKKLRVLDIAIIYRMSRNYVINKKEIVEKVEKDI